MGERSGGDGWKRDERRGGRSSGERKTRFVCEAAGGGPSETIQAMADALFLVGLTIGLLLVLLLLLLQVLVPMQVRGLALAVDGLGTVSLC